MPFDVYSILITILFPVKVPHRQKPDHEEVSNPTISLTLTQSASALLVVLFETTQKHGSFSQVYSAQKSNACEWSKAPHFNNSSGNFFPSFEVIFDKKTAQIIYSMASNKQITDMKSTYNDINSE